MVTAQPRPAVYKCKKAQVVVYLSFRFCYRYLNSFAYAIFIIAHIATINNSETET